MKQMFIAFQTGDGFWDKIIKFVEKDLEHDFNAPRPLATHAYLIFGTDNHWTGVEAVPPVVRMWDIPSDPRIWDRRYIVPMTDDEFDVSLQYALDRVGDGYRYSGQLIAGLYCLTHIPVFKPDRIRVICSELCVDAMRNSDVTLFENIPADDITPANLEAWAVDHLKRSDY